jgi:hypothetical protein
MKQKLLKKARPNSADENRERSGRFPERENLNRKIRIITKKLNRYKKAGMKNPMVKRLLFSLRRRDDILIDPRIMLQSA